LREEVEVVVAAGAGVDDGGEVAGDDEGVTLVVFAEGEGEFQGRDGGANRGAVAPGLAVDGGLAIGGEGVDEGFSVLCEIGDVGGDAGFEGRALFVGEGILIDAGMFAPEYSTKDEFTVGRKIDGRGTAFVEKGGSPLGNR
jgi:hypothetical protein